MELLKYDDCSNKLKDSEEETSPAVELEEEISEMPVNTIPGVVLQKTLTKKRRGDDGDAVEEREKAKPVKKKRGREVKENEWQLKSSLEVRLSINLNLLSNC